MREGQNHFPHPASHSASDAIQNLFGFLGCKCTLSVQVFIKHHIQVLLYRATFDHFSTQTVGVRGIVLILEDFRSDNNCPFLITHRKLNTEVCVFIESSSQEILRSHLDIIYCFFKQLESHFSEVHGPDLALCKDCIEIKAQSGRARSLQPRQPPILSSLMSFSALVSKRSSKISLLVDLSSTWTRKLFSTHPSSLQHCLQPAVLLSQADTQVVVIPHLDDSW